MPPKHAYHSVELISVEHLRRLEQTLKIKIYSCKRSKYDYEKEMVDFTLSIINKEPFKMRVLRIPYKVYDAIREGGERI